MFFVAFMQFTASLATEILNIYSFCVETDGWNIFQNIFVLLIISLLEDGVVLILNNNVAKGLLSEGATLNFKKVSAIELLQADQSILHRGLWLLYIILQVFYDSLYFYFM
jgi:hypothetical protein